MTGDVRIFNSINTNDSNGYDSITFGDNGKGKVAFAPHKTSFVKKNGWFYTNYKQVGHVEQKYMKKKPQANVSSIKLDSFYVLTKGTNGVKAKFIGAAWMGSKKKAIWVPKSLVANL